jgi:ribonucleoside-diphosphate reductase alpha chain
MAGFEQPISEYIWDLKYRYQSLDKIVDHTLEDTWHRVARAASEPEANRKKNYWSKQFYSVLEDFVFLPGGRILAGAGIEQDVTLFNCFVMKIKEDSLTGIFNALKEGAITLQKGGGVGYDFSILRPKGAVCHNTQAVASGPVSFMKVWNAMSATMLSSAARRGAMMANLRCDHPDIEEFIQIKADENELRQFNLSVIVTDEFMAAVAADDDWPLVYPAPPEISQTKVIQRRWSNSRAKVPCEIFKVIRARKLWEDIIRAAYTYAEPGVIFEDTINTFNPLYYHEWLNATNPCGEIPLPAYGACNLGSLNLTKFVRSPFTERAYFDWRALEDATSIATRFLDNIVEVSHYPLKVQKTLSLNTRRLGLGFTGLANTFIMLGISYGSPESLKLAAELSKKIAYITWKTSNQLGKEKGSFPYFNKKYLRGTFIQTLPEELQREVAHHGLRNSHHNAIAPTGSISLFANNISGGLEPVFSATYERQVRMKSGELASFLVEDYAYYRWKKMGKLGLPSAWVEMGHLKPEDHLNIQAVVQPFIDNAISKTINLPVDFPFSELNEVYSTAFKLKLKGCTVFRPNPTTGSILSNANEKCGYCYD